MSGLVSRARVAIARPVMSQVRSGLCSLLAGLAEAGSKVLTRSPHTPIVGLARTLVALGTLLTLLCTPQDALFFRSEAFNAGAVCDTRMSFLSLHCLVGDRVDISVWLSVAILFAVCSGYAPALTAVPHWWVAWSLNVSSPLRDGGDQVAAALTFLLVPLLLVDRRLNHWQQDRGFGGRTVLAKSVAHATVVLVAIQTIFIYGHAAIGKFTVAEWSNGTAIWYWIQDPAFAPPGFMDAALRLVHATTMGSIALNYGALAIELGLAVAVLGSRRSRRAALVAGISFHVMIAVVFGLWSFLFSMVALLMVAFVRPTDAPMVRTS